MLKEGSVIIESTSGNTGIDSHLSQQQGDTVSFYNARDNEHRAEKLSAATEQNSS